MGVLRRGIACAVVALTSISTGALSPASAVPSVMPAAAASSCTPAFIGVPGSGQHSFSKEMATVAKQLKADAGGASKVNTTYAQLKYPAVPWYKYEIPWNNLNRSEVSGVKALEAAVKKLRQGCTSRQIAIAGYSQGAEVVVRAVAKLPRSAWSNISVALLGNPSFTSKRKGDQDHNTAGQGIRPTGHQGRYLLPSDVLARTLDICAKGDPICSFRPLVWNSQTLALIDGRSAHYAYVKLGYAKQAANYLWSLVMPGAAFTVKSLSDLCGTLAVPAVDSPTKKSVKATVVRHSWALGVVSCATTMKYVRDVYTHSASQLNVSPNSQSGVLEGSLLCTWPDSVEQDGVPNGVLLLNCPVYAADQLEDETTAAIQVFADTPAGGVASTCSGPAIASAIKAADLAHDDTGDQAVTNHACWGVYAIAEISNPCCNGTALLKFSAGKWHAVRLGSEQDLFAVYADISNFGVAIPLGVAETLATKSSTHEDVSLQ